MSLKSGTKAYGSDRRQSLRLQLQCYDCIRCSKHERRNGLEADLRRTGHEWQLPDKNGRFCPLFPALLEIKRLAMTKTPGKTFAVLAGFCHIEA
ncbi:hypothetical protein [Paracoccus sp. Ld10]|uniref:hypothetical protein n=1 Tax=Paracoccus sp. Ld10 TaxID=649158 RepID=UPI003866E12F